ncbi:hypothetical protein J5N97_005027 [Dioscorea zingiberensis]|uniref:Uncharacterized protein n=1 Tax=Dioscorea zingiberensis TaxID=325984 RepID=A0A9D5HSD2_9LILI|nr:hypothetical protein J5N97_005027 [Dioscorea zingiberensis]
MKDNPGHHVALVTFCFSKCEDQEAAAAVRLTRIKLLKPKDTLLLGHVYRLVSSQEVAKALRARKYEKMIKKEQQEIRQKQFNPGTRTDHGEEMRDKVAMQEKDGQRSTHPTNTTTRARQWRPSLQSISEIVS